MNVLIEQIKNHPSRDGHTIVAVQSTIAGHHVFRRRPLSGLRFPLILKRESNNPVHSNAIMVESGCEDSYTTTVRSIVNDNGLDLFEKQIGRCPRKLADILAPLFDKTVILQGRGVCSGVRKFLGHDEGGGQHLECIYMLKSKNAETGNNLKDVLNDNGFSAFLVLNE